MRDETECANRTQTNNEKALPSKDRSGYRCSMTGVPFFGRDRGTGYDLRAVLVVSNDVCAGCRCGHLWRSSAYRQHNAAAHF
ncbi:MAG: hypothetical protein J6I50_00335 [Clostridia bacterium]|nr:hypothetical protein [Clostridia bacterium]